MPKLAECISAKEIKVLCKNCGCYLGYGLAGMSFKCVECGHWNKLEAKTTPLKGKSSEA